MNAPASPPIQTPDLPDLPCYLNGVYGSVRDAKVSVLDRGFIFGDGVYEVIPVYAGQPFRLAQHLARLSRNLKELRIPNPHPDAEWGRIASNLVAKFSTSTGANSLYDNALVYLQVTRGVAVRDHAMLPGLTPTVFAMVNAMKLPTEEQRRIGVACVTADDFRWEKAHIKSTSLLGAVFARQLGVDANATETIMFRRGMLSEAAASNVWLVKGGAVYGPPTDNLVLEGIRYGLMGELCEACNIPFELRRIARSEVMAADELLLSSATKEILPVTTLDGQPVGTGVAKGVPGPIHSALHAAYQRAKQRSAPFA